MQIEQGRLQAIEADITTLEVDAIVNAANSRLVAGGGVDGAIRRAAGPALNAELTQIAVCAPGSAIITPGYRLPARNIIHTVAPIWGQRMNRAEQEDTLASCYEHTLRLADIHQILTIAFPALGTGAYGWPADYAAEIAFSAVTDHLREGGLQERVIFCCFNRSDFERYSSLIVLAERGVGYKS